MSSSNSDSSTSVNCEFITKLYNTSFEEKHEIQQMFTYDGEQYLFHLLETLCEDFAQKVMEDKKDERYTELDMDSLYAFEWFNTITNKDTFLVDQKQLRNAIEDRKVYLKQKNRKHYRHGYKHYHHRPYQVCTPAKQIPQQQIKKNFKKPHYYQMIGKGFKGIIMHLTKKFSIPYKQRTHNS